VHPLTSETSVQPTEAVDAAPDIVSLLLHDLEI
jgi:hypothetical protein